VQPSSVIKAATELFPLATPPVNPMTGVIPLRQRGLEDRSPEVIEEVLLSTEAKSSKWYGQGPETAQLDLRHFIR
jgi:hypothetical protein